MTFLELAQKIDTLKTTIAAKVADLSVAESDYAQIQARHKVELDTALDVVSDKKAAHRNSNSELQKLFGELQSLIGNNDAVVDPGEPDQKELFLAGQRARASRNR